MPAPPDPNTLAAPLLLYPLEGETVDAAAPAFRWRPVPGAVRYTVQVGTAPTFTREEASLDAGEATEISVHDVLQPTGQPLAWRVRAERGGEPGPWSAFGRFVPGTDHAVDAFIAQRDAERHEERRLERRRQADEQAARDLIPPHSRPDHIPTDNQIRLMGLLIFCGMLLTGLLIFTASRGI